MCKVLILELGFLSDEKGEEGDDMTVKSTRDVWACRSFLEVHLPGAINKELSENVEGFWKLASVGRGIGPSKCVMKMMGGDQERRSQIFSFWSWGLWLRDLYRTATTFSGISPGASHPFSGLQADHVLSVLLTVKEMEIPMETLASRILVISAVPSLSCPPNTSCLRRRRIHRAHEESR